MTWQTPAPDGDVCSFLPGKVHPPYTIMRYPATEATHGTYAEGKDPAMAPVAYDKVGGGQNRRRRCMLSFASG